MAADVPAVGAATQATATATLPATAAVGGTVGGASVAAVQAAGRVAGSGDVLQQAARQVVATLPGRNQFSFQFDRATGMTIVKVYNADTGELVRQIPTEEIVRIAQLMRQEEAHPNVVDVTA